MSNRNKHLNFLENKKNFDIVIIGGGISGAGIGWATSLNGISTVILEARDFGFSTSGNSSKLVHGGLRYLKNGQFKVTFDSVREREKLLKELSGLVWPISFVIPIYSKEFKFVYKLGLSIYDLFAGRKSHNYISSENLLNEFRYLNKQIWKGELIGGYEYQDAQTDDIRLLIRTLKEAEKNGCTILNYFPVRDLIIKDGCVKGVVAYDEIHKKEYQIYSKIVINACGFQSDFFRGKMGLAPIMRPLRGSHLIFNYEKLPIRRALGFSHPIDKRNIFVLPWFGKIVLGTTDVDHSLNLLPGKTSISEISQEEIDYLLEGIQYYFPEISFSREDIFNSWSGIRPVVSSDRRKSPSKESRDVYIEFYNHLITVTGGKLTSFRLEAIKTLKLLKKFFSIKHQNLVFRKVHPVLNKDWHQNIPQEDIFRIFGFYGEDAINILNSILQNPDVVDKFHYFSDNNHIYKEELIYSQKYEWVTNKEDLYYRRFRFGLLKKKLSLI